MWTLGLVMWLFDRDRTATIDNLHAKFKTKPEIAEANVAALNAGHAYGETAELPSGGSLQGSSGRCGTRLYRNTTGTEALAYGLLAGAQLAELLDLFLSNNPSL